MPGIPGNHKETLGSLGIPGIPWDHWEPWESLDDLELLYDQVGKCRIHTMGVRSHLGSSILCAPRSVYDRTHRSQV